MNLLLMLNQGLWASVDALVFCPPCSGEYYSSYSNRTPADLWENPPSHSPLADVPWGLSQCLSDPWLFSEEQIA